MSEHIFVITGGPGSGKSSLIAALAREGMPYMPEAGRAIIQDQVSIEGQALPWADREAFAQLMLGWELRSHREARAMPGPIIVDRGIPDVIGYLTLCGLPVPPHVHRAAQRYRYNRQVFIAPHWPDIFTHDQQRRQDATEAEATYQAMVSTYTSLDYELIPLPLSSVSERAAFVKARIGSVPDDHHRQHHHQQ
ncbi:AAA family ATPase [Halomonas huangheensis]|uniref:NadR/Ttd14 AAA domain-containing protein n=1 Tax=Halomonas huangheensis TaxID=1178482 RepID=W1N342_9GAMM|nr:AAA family ATPase [Halomonas huangheensis]ALM51473.1 ATPase [Halomonas huangheensis]ERL49928.1 hypothetical protein BJB45_02045 [Halomonas huangheensis]